MCVKGHILISVSLSLLFPAHSDSEWAEGSKTKNSSSGYFGCFLET